MSYEDLNILRMQFATGVGTQDRIAAAKKELLQYAQYTDFVTRAFNLADTDGFIRRVEKSLNKETSHAMLYRYGTKYASRRP